MLAGHNGAGKSTMWRQRLSGQLEIPLINADRLMLSILPEPDGNGALVTWAQALRDNDQSWMKVAQDGVQAFVGHAMRWHVQSALNGFDDLDPKTAIANARSDLTALLRCLDAAEKAPLVLLIERVESRIGGDCRVGRSDAANQANLQVARLVVT